MSLIGVAGFPTKGWIEQYVVDLGKNDEDHEMCEYCGKEWVRYQHHVSHSEGLWNSLNVGCVCAGNLTGQPQISEKSDRIARNISARRANWCGLKGWHVGRKGGLILKKDGRIFALNSGKFGGWSGSWTGRGDEVWQRVGGWLKDLDEAKLALFDAVYGATGDEEGEVAA
jgi:hypothetical protein